MGIDQNLRIDEELTAHEAHLEKAEVSSASRSLSAGGQSAPARLTVTFSFAHYHLQLICDHRTDGSPLFGRENARFPQKVSLNFQGDVRFMVAPIYVLFVKYRNSRDGRGFCPYVTGIKSFLAFDHALYVRARLP